MPEVLVKAWECNRCHKVWAKKINGHGNLIKKPMCCPSCCSPYWDKKRIYEKRNVEVKEDD